MGCCKCKECLWRDSLKVVYTDPKDGKEYCLFHAPAEHKGCSVDEFNAKVFEWIQEAIDFNEEEVACDLSGTIFPGNIKFPSKLPKISFVRAHFPVDTSFEETTFSYRADFSSAIFETGGKGAVCMIRPSFKSAIFKGDVNFNDTKFKYGVDFTSAEFGKNGTANFNSTEFNEEVSFDKTRFSGHSDFYEAVFSGDINFTHVIFAEEVSFGIDEFGTSQESRTKFEKKTSFESVTFGNGASFVSFDYNSDTTIKFADCKVLSGSIVFSFCEDPTCLDLTQQYDLTNIRFINSPWEKNYRIKACTEENSLQPTRDFYQRMKAKYKAENNEYEASKWHVAEKEAQLKLLWRNKDEEFNWFMLWLYKAVSGFGENPRRAFKVLLSLIALPLLFLLVAASADVQIDFLGWTFHSSPTADVIGEWLKYIPLTRAMAGEPSSGWRALMFLWQLLITIQAALFAFALRNNFRR